MRGALLTTLLLCGLPASVLAQGLAVVRVSEDGALQRRPVQARVGEVVTLRVVAADRRGRLLPLAAGARVSWFQVTPRMQHTETPAPNASTNQYSNSVLFGPRHGQWIGYDEIEYEMVLAGESDGDLVVDRDPSRGGGTHGAGTSWFAATVTDADGRVRRTADASDVDRLGLRSDVLRVSFRTGDDFLGWLSTYFNVPNVFGSTGPQADRYVGADCADVLVGARRASGDRRMSYASVAGIATVARPVTGVLALGADGLVRDQAGAAVALRWGESVEAGDLFAIDYTTAGAQLPRPWDHIGALLGDADGAGILDGADLLRHMTPGGLLDRSLSREGPIRFRVWRFSGGRGGGAAPARPSGRPRPGPRSG